MGSTHAGVTEGMSELWTLRSPAGRFESKLWARPSLTKTGFDYCREKFKGHVRIGDIVGAPKGHKIEDRYDVTVKGRLGVKEWTEGTESWGRFYPLRSNVAFDIHSSKVSRTCRVRSFVANRVI